MLPLFGTKDKEERSTAAYGHLVVNAGGEIVMANPYFIDIARLKVRKRINLRDIIGKTIREVFGENTGDTFVGIFMKHKNPFAGQFMIGNKLFQVVVEEVKKGEEIYYEFFYFPIKNKHDRSNHRFLQKMVYEIARSKGYTDIEWILEIPDEHCKKLLSCLASHEHSTIPDRYCPNKHRCGFNTVHGWLQLDRRAFYRTKVNLAGELYLKAAKDRPVPSPLARKKLLCQAVDLSVAGIRLKLAVYLPKGCVVRLVFEEFEAEGMIVWTKRSHDHWLTGVKFTNLTEEQQSKVIVAMNKRRIVVD